MLNKERATFEETWQKVKVSVVFSFLLCVLTILSTPFHLFACFWAYNIHTYHKYIMFSDLLRKKMGVENMYFEW